MHQKYIIREFFFERRKFSLAISYQVNNQNLTYTENMALVLWIIDYTLNSQQILM